MKPVLLPKVWGGRRLERLGKALPAGERIGESWELADVGATSVSGAGGGAVRTVIEGGPLAGRTLGEACAMMGRDLMGDVAAADGGGFPLLVKFLDASENLSVQVHPSPAYAAAHRGGVGGAHLKTESWSIVAAEPGAVLYIGLAEGVGMAEFARACRAGDGAAVESMLRRVPAVAGECHTLPSGTVHALGAGVVVAEVQTPSDTTFRLHDWGRKGRELHVEAALESMSDPTIGAPERRSLGEGELCGRVATTAHYTIDEARPLAGDDVTIGYACKRGACGPFVLTVLSGHGELRHAGGGEGFEPVEVSIGRTVLVPAAAAKQTVLRASADGEGMRVLRVGVGG